MKKMTVLLLFFAALTLGCARKTSTEEVKENLIKAMTARLQRDPLASAASSHFAIMDVSYFKIGPFYRCEFKVKLTRSNGTDTTGIIRGKIATDYSEVIK